MLYANLLLNVLYHIKIEMKIRESCLQTGNFIYKPGISLTKQDFHLQRGSLGLQRGFSGYYLPILDKIVNKKVDIVTNCLKKCAQRSLINSFEKKSDENERKYREDIIEASFKILKIEL